MVSLNFDEMDNCGITYKGKSIKSLSTQLDQVFNPDEGAINDITVVRKG